MSMSRSQIPSTDRQPWGALPAEQYLLANWDPHSDEGTTEQYHRLIGQFLRSGKIMGEPRQQETSAPQMIYPSQDDIDLILKPWRSEKLRKIAAELMEPTGDIYDDCVKILRVHYDDDDAFQRMLEEDENCEPAWDPDEQWRRMIEDSDHFNVGSEWRRALSVLPELTATGRGLGVEGCVSVDDLKEAMHNAKEYNENHEQLIQWSAARNGKALAIFDENSVAAGALKVYHLDRHGNVVRSTTADVDDLTIWRMAMDRSNAQNYPMWTDAKLGTEYEGNGSVGKELYDKAMELASY